MTDYYEMYKQAQKTEWIEYYVDYAAAKEKLHLYRKQRRAWARSFSRGDAIPPISFRKHEPIEMVVEGVHTTPMEDPVMAARSFDGEAGAQQAEDTMGYSMSLDDRVEGAADKGTSTGLDWKQMMHRLHMEERVDFANFIEGELRRASELHQKVVHNLEHWIQRDDADEDDSDAPSDREHGYKDIAAAGYSQPQQVQQQQIQPQQQQQSTQQLIPTDGGAAMVGTTTQEEPTANIQIEIGKSGLRPSRRQLKEQLLDIYAFCVANIITVRQLLLKYDAIVLTYDGITLTEWDLKRQGRLNDTFFCMSVLKDLHTDLLVKFFQGISDNSAENNTTADGGIDPSDMKEQICDVHRILDKTLKRCEKVAGGQIVVKDRLIYMMRQYIVVGFQRSGLLLEPENLRARGQSLQSDMRRLVRWIYRNHDLAMMWSSRDSSFAAMSQMDSTNVWPLILNLISCFLFMMNNYIIEPSSAYYANALGSSDALSGIMIGAAPWFALLSSVGYSFWTNASYKQPIVFASLLMMIGNTLYAAAYSYRSMEMCLIGRAITGLGAPRIINRRYVADATPFSLRTMASAAFALMTALGAALGPGMAIALDMVTPFQFNLPFLGMQYFNGMTGPGYFMALCWAIYLIAVIVSFREPRRSGLAELKRRESAELEQSLSMDEPRSGFATTDAMRDDGSDCAKSDYYDDDDEEDDSGSSSGGAGGANKGVLMNSPFYCIRNMNRATALCMVLIFMKRISLESVVGSTSVITKNRFHWSIKNVGSLHLANGIVVIPISILAGWMSQYHSDRLLASWFMTITIVGMLLLVDPTDLVDAESSDSYNDTHVFAVGPLRYVVGSLVAFSGIEACESFVASMMSKVVPSALAVGTFNSGLLTTLVGTSGRAVGDAFITWMGLISIRNLLNLLILPGLALVLISLTLLRRNYHIVGV